MLLNDKIRPRTDGVPSQANASSMEECPLAISKFSELVLQISVLLMESGAHCERVHRNVQRLAATTPFSVELFISFNAVTASVTDSKNSHEVYTASRTVKHRGVHFGIVTNTSVLTWKVHDLELPLSELEKAIETVRKTPKYPVWLIRLSIGVACASLCILAGGDWMDGLFAFAASFIGLLSRQTMVAFGYNIMLAFTVSSLVTTCIAGLDGVFSIGAAPDRAVATAVLFLIPGVPLINSIIDLLKGYISMGIARGTYAGFLLLSIAVGMFAAISLIGINNF